MLSKLVPSPLPKFFLFWNCEENYTETRLKHIIYNLKSESECCSVVSDSLQPHGLYSPWNSPGQNTGVGSLSLLQGTFPTQGSNPCLLHCRSPALQMDSLPAEPQGKPKNTEVGSLSLLQWIFLTQESNQCLLHCRQILCQLSYEGSPYIQPGYLEICKEDMEDFETYVYYERDCVLESDDVT